MEDAIKLSLFIIQEAVKSEPAVAKMLQDLFNKGDPTDADWDNLRARVNAKSYADYVPTSKIPKSDFSR